MDDVAKLLGALGSLMFFGFLLIVFGVIFWLIVGTTGLLIVGAVIVSLIALMLHNKRRARMRAYPSDDRGGGGQ